MFFKNKKNQAKERAEGTVAKKQSVAGFLFNPKIGDDIRPIGESISMFVRLIALIFAANGLFPRNHPALLGEPGHRLTLGMIIATAYRDVNFTREGMPKAILFFAVTGCLVFSALAIISVLLLLLINTAHAAPPTEGLFDLDQTQKETDLALIWLDYLFTNKTLSTDITTAMPSLSGNGEDLGIIQKALRTGLATYSSAVLVLGGVILMYHLLSMVAETAHTGKPMGRANQIWAPIRLVVAIGLLVPISESGLNMGQQATVQVARWGSSLASNTWSVFMEEFGAALAKAKETPPPLPLVDKIAEDLLVMSACMKGYNHQFGWNLWDDALNFITDFSFGLPGGETIKKIIMHDGNSLSRVVKFVPGVEISKNNSVWGIISGSDIIAYKSFFSNYMGPICGYYKFNIPITSNDSQLANSQFFVDLQKHNQTSIDKFAKALSGDGFCEEFDGDCSDLPEKIIDLMDKNSGGYDTQDTDPVMATDFYKVRDSLKTILTKNAKEAYESYKEKIPGDMQNKLDLFTKDGWVSAGSWLNTLARIQGNVIDEMYNAFPKTASPLAKDLPNALYSLFGNADLDNVMSVLAHYKRLIRGETFGDDLPQEQAAKVAAAGAATEKGDNMGTGALFYFLLAIDELGQAFGAWPEIDSESCKKEDTGINSCVLWKLESSNPLGELATLGHNNLNIGLSLIAYGMAANFSGALYNKVDPSNSKIPVARLLPDAINSFIGAGMEIFGSLFIVFGTTFTMTGIMLAYILPLIPFVRFFFNTMNWTIMLFEAIVSMPIFALAHLSPTGDGLPGDMAKPGYFFLLAIMLRPVLMVFGLIAGLLLFNVAIGFLNKSFMIAAVGTGAAAGGGGWATIAKFIYSVMYLVLAYICANTCFKAIGHFPDHALRWMNGVSPSTKDLGDSSTFNNIMSVAAGYVGSQAVQPLTGSAKGVGEKVGENIKNVKAPRTTVTSSS